MSVLRDTDLDNFAKLGITEAQLAAAGIERVTDAEAKERFGITCSGDRTGIIFPYYDPATGKRVTARLRRDNPPVEAGKPQDKYISAYGDRKHLYFPPECAPVLTDVSVPVVVVESEKSVLTGTEFAVRTKRSFLFIATGGCWGWRGRIGIAENAKGERIEEKGVLPDFGLLQWQNRKVILAYDADTASNVKVRAARWALAEELTARGASVRFAELPQVDGANGPDDIVGICGDDILAAILDGAPLFPDVARATARAAIESIELQITPVEPEQISALYEALAVVDAADTRNLLMARAAKVLRGTISKADLAKGVARHHALLSKERTEIQERARVAAMVKVEVNPTALIKTLETFFAERAFLPVGAALLLAFFVLLTWTFELFDSCPYVLLESATVECGKTTIVGLLHALCARAMRATALTEATLFRIVAESAPTLLIDEAESLEGSSERAKALKVIAHEGYKKGAKVPRIEGEDRHVQWFPVFCPKVFSAIGGLTGALLSRCIVIHMTRCPKNVSRRSTRLRAVERDAKSLLPLLEAYSLQCREQLTKLYEEEPDAGYWPSVSARESEIWEPMLIHARVAGPDVEAELLEVFQTFVKGKRAIQANDWQIARTATVRDAIAKLITERFIPGDLVERLDDSEAWASSFAKFKDDDAGKRAKAVKVGRFLRTFRLAAKREERGSSYSRQEALAALSAHIPEDPDAPVFNYKPRSAAEVLSRIEQDEELTA